MAEALVSALVGTIIGNFNSAALQEIKLFWGLKDELERLESVFRTIQLVLQDAEVKQRNNEVLQNWLRKLRDVAYDADDVLDQIATAGLRRRWISERGKRGYLTTLTSFFSKRNQFSCRLEIAQKVRDIRGRLDALSDERLRFHLREGMMSNQVGVVESRQTNSLVNESEIFGRDEEREIIVQKLICDMAVQDDLSVCAVWGMGGIGKTTLTQLVYNDERVEKHFELRIWVCVSEDFSLQRLVKAILEDVQGVGCSLTELNPLIRLLQDQLRGKKFLLVLDDVWNEDQSLWDRLKEALRCGSKGSGVMVTTRNENIAGMMATDHETMSHRIGYLSEADSWSLFKRRAFACRTEDENLVGIGEEIVKKCGGVPLAIKALGSLMRSKSHESEWLAVKESETWNQQGHGNDIFPVLMLSYDNLSPQMRQCFSYCCVFPKDYWMDKDELIQLWMANGFLHEEGQKDLYLIGQLIFKELVWRSFLQDVEKHQIWRMRCKMHDLMHDLAESVMRQETYNLVVDYNVQKIPPRVRHLSCDQSLEMIEEKRDKHQLLNVDTFHSLIHLGDSIFFEFGKFSFSVLSNQQHLRVLDWRFFTIKRLSKIVDKWEHLRFLSMSCYELTTLPESLTRLHNLQTLKLTSTSNLRKLPEGLKYMKNLWFVEIESHDSLICTPPGIGELTSLQRLSVFVVGEDSAHQISQLKELNLRGQLSIRGLEKVRDVKAANMITKRNLTSLNLSWTSDANKISMEHFEATLEDIQPHHNLEKICISSYQGSRIPNWMSAPAFINLSEITLERCEKCKHLPPLGKLPALKVLELVGLDSIRRLDGEWCGDGSSSFVALTKLSISRMLNLEEWIVPNSHESFLLLQYLDIGRCPGLIRLPFLPALKNLDIKRTNNPAVLGSMVATSIESLHLSDDADELSLLPGGLLSAQKNLKELQVNDCPDLRSLSNMLDELYYLKKLHFSRCYKLEYPPEGLKFLSSLEELRFSFCDSLRIFPAAILENMPSLRSLSFSFCQKLDPLSGPPLQRVFATSRLHELAIVDCPELKCLPECIQQLSVSLRTLRIVSCDGLCSLPDWIGDLQSLSTFDLEGCTKLSSLPDGIGDLQSLSTFDLWGCIKLSSLPDGLGNLKSLSVLDMRECSPILVKRCKKSKGVDWPKISHIPKIYI